MLNTNKLDELHRLLHTKKVKNLAQLVCISESWLTPDVPHQRTQLNGYEQFRHGRSLQDSRNQSGGGLLLYIEQKWSSSNQVIHKHTDGHLQILSVKSRPQWLPREISSIITVTCYAHFTMNSSIKSAANKTVNNIKSHVNRLENKYPDAYHDLIMGYVNQLPFHFQNYYQIVCKPTRGRNTLDNCYINVKNSHKQCNQLAPLSNSDHFVMHLVPTYKPLSMETLS